MINTVLNTTAYLMVIQDIESIPVVKHTQRTADNHETDNNRCQKRPCNASFAWN